MTQRRTRLAVWRDTPLLGVIGDVGNFLLFALRRYIADGMTLAAGALTYSTLLALIPLLVIAFAVLSGFSAFDTIKLRMEDLVLGALVPEVGAGAKTYLTDFTRNATNLTAVGIVALAFAAVLLLSTIEGTLNRIWRVERSRPFGRRLMIFWAVLTVGPLFLGASFALSSDVLSEAQKWLAEASGQPTTRQASNGLRIAIAIFSQSAALTLLFLLVPARPVRLRDAAIGGFFGGIALQALRFGFNLFLTSSTTYTTIYGAVAIFPIFLLWLYSCWTVIIIGAVLAASFPDWWRRRDAVTGAELTPPDRLQIAIALLAVLSNQAKTGGSVSQDLLAETVPLDARDAIVELLTAKGYVVNTEDQRLSLSRDLHQASLSELAQDLGLSLGKRPRPHGEPAYADRIPNNGSLAEQLLALGRAEDEIMGQTVADVIAGDAGLPDLGPSAVHLRKSS